MKRLIFFLLAMSVVSYGWAQCDGMGKAKGCAPKPDSGYTLIKSFAVNGDNGKKDKIEYSYVFTKGTKYLLNVCADGESTDGVVVTLYDKYRNQVATSLLNGKPLKAIAYPCSATGIYYITYTFKESKGYCAGSTIGFKRHT